MDNDTARRERPDFGLERGRNLVYVGRNTTIADVVKHIDELYAEIETLRTTYDSLALHCTQRETLLQSLIALRNEQTTEIAALRAAVKELEYANAMFTAENKSLREAIIGMEGGLNVADSWRNHPTVRSVLGESDDR